VPAKAPIVTAAKLSGINNAAVLQVTEDDELHDTVKQIFWPKTLDAVKSRVPKDRPETVTDEVPESATFLTPAECAGESNVYTFIPVPATALSVTCATLKSFASSSVKTEIEVAVSHEVLVTITAETPLVAVRSDLPKFSPVTVTDAPPVCGMFINTEERIGASNEKPGVLVPATAVTVTAVCSANEAELNATHWSTVEDAHVVVMQLTESWLILGVKLDKPKLSPLTLT
jgi:hypothetical protein